MHTWILPGVLFPEIGFLWWVLESGVLWTERTLECLERLKFSQGLPHSSSRTMQGAKHKLALHKTHVLFFSVHV